MEIVPGIHQVDGVNGNAYILIRDGLVVIDTGISGSGRKILMYIRKKLHRKPSEITTVVITHYPIDHTGGVRELKKASPALKTAVHEADAGYVSGQVPIPRHPGLKGLLLWMVTTLKPVRFTPDIILQEGDRIGGVTCIHLPGHTPGSIGLLDGASGTLFAGDAIRTDGTSLSEGPAGFTTDLPRSRESIRKIAALEFDTLLAGHGKPLWPDAAARVREFAATLPVPS